MSPNKTFISILVFTLTLCLGIFISIKSWKGLVYWYPDNNRNPAAIKKVFDFSHLEGRALEMASYKRLIADARILEGNESLGLELGHFVIKDEEAKRQFACNVYNRIELQFKSADMSVNGEPSVMTIEAHCLVNDDINRIHPVWIPMKKILSEREGDIQLHWKEQGDIHISFTNIGDSWPRAWTVSNVKMFNDNDLSKFMQIDQTQMKQILEKPLTLVWDRDL